MYSDPAKLRIHPVKLRFSAEESALVDAWVNYTGEEKAPLLRRLILEQAVQALQGHDVRIGEDLGAPLEAAIKALMSA